MPRLESLAGLSVQDAELKLFPESNSAIAAGKERTASTDAESSRADQGLVAESGVRCGDSYCQREKNKRQEEEEERYLAARTALDHAFR